MSAMNNMMNKVTLFVLTFYIFYHASLTLATSIVSMTAGSFKKGASVNHPKLEVQGHDGVNADLISDDNYLVMLDEQVVDVKATLETLVGDSGASIDHVFEHVFKGGIIGNITGQMLKSVLDHELVTNASRELKGLKESSPDGIEGRFTAEIIEQSNNVSWGLDRIDQETPALDSKYTYNYDGAGVTICFISAGARMSHVDFGDRAFCAYDGFDDNCADTLNGVSTSVLGSAAGTTFGVAKNASMAVVKSHPGNGELSTRSFPVGIEECIKLKQAKPDEPMVILTSLQSPLPAVTWIRAANAATREGIVVVTGAGNSENNACLYRPGSIDGVINVGGTYRNDSIVLSSNYGRCVDIFAPGSQVEAILGTNDTATAKIGCNCMAAGLVAGVVALHLQKDPTMTPDEIWKTIEADAVKDKITFAGLRGRDRSPNLLINTKSLL